jgi:hypothetical protein
VGIRRRSGWICEGDRGEMGVGLTMCNSRRRGEGKPD